VTVEMTVEVVGEGTRTVRLADDATYADLLQAVDLRVHEATALVGGTPVAEDGPVDPTADVRVLRLIKGG
jgi:sulfur carrier protein